MFNREGRVELEWKAGSGMMMKAEGDPADMTMALMLGLREVVEHKVPAEKQREAMRQMADHMLELMDVQTATIDLTALRGAGQ